jgi:2-polyprenyl-3-methyl-5-hydroxy-6-metoxy-1,4-benzoquinol methylase
MNFTGERPTLQEGILASRMRYKSILPFCLDKNIYDFGCGIGQGTFFLSKFSRTIMGYDPSKEAIAEAVQAFPGISFVSEFNLEDLKHIDRMTLLEVFEHIEKPEAEELLKTLSENVGELVVTTPNGDLFPYHPQNLVERRGYHLWHYTESELRNLFRKYFKFVEITGHLRDPLLSSAGNFTGYVIFASNKITWKEEWLTELHCQ